MRSGLFKAYIFVSLVAVGAAAVDGSPDGPRAAQPPPILSKRVASFKAQRLCLVDALLRLGQQEQVPLGIEYVDREALEKPIGKDLAETTVGEIVQVLLGGNKGYTWRLRDNVLNISHESVASGKANLMDRALPEFAIPKYSLAEASNVLYMDLHRLLHPEVTGYAGEYSPGNMQNFIGPLELRNAPVRLVLNRLISSANKVGAWIVRVPPGHLEQLPTNGLWTIIEYETPPRQYAEDLRRQVYGR